MTKPPINFSYSPQGLLFHYGEAVHRVKRVLQANEFISVEYYLEGQIDPDTQKQLSFTIIHNFEKEKEDAT